MDKKPAPAWEPFLIAYLSGDKGALTNLFSTATKPIQRFVKRVAPSLPEDLREDVAQQVFVRLIEKPPEYVAEKLSASSLLFGLVRDAIKQVRATFAAPGQRTRLRITTQNEETEEAAVFQTNVAVVAGSDDTDEIIEQAPSHRWTAEQATANILTYDLLKKLPERSASALWLVYAESMTVSDAARELGRSRFQVARDLKLGHTMALNAAAMQPFALAFAA